MAISNYLWLETVISTPLESFATIMSRLTEFFSNLCTIIHIVKMQQKTNKQYWIYKLANSWWNSSSGTNQPSQTPFPPKKIMLNSTHSNSNGFSYISSLSSSSRNDVSKTLEPPRCAAKCNTVEPPAKPPSFREAELEMEVFCGQLRGKRKWGNG